MSRRLIIPVPLCRQPPCSGDPEPGPSFGLDTKEAKHQVPTLWYVAYCCRTNQLSAELVRLRTGGLRQSSTSHRLFFRLTDTARYVERDGRSLGGFICDAAAGVFCDSGHLQAYRVEDYTLPGVMDGNETVSSVTRK